jgi:hypothetical protein
MQTNRRADAPPLASIQPITNRRADAPPLASIQPVTIRMQSSGCVRFSVWSGRTLLYEMLLQMMQNVKDAVIYAVLLQHFLYLPL